MLARALFFILAWSVSSGFVFAQDTIPSFDARITVYDDARMEVAEQIVYDFGERERHGIFRIIPYSYQAGTATYEASISDVAVFDKDGTPIPFTQSRSTGELTLKVGDPETVVQGVQTYKLTYTVQGPFLYFEKQDELYWNVTGVWSQGIAEASVLFDFPSGAKVLKASCFQGAKGAGRECDEGEQLVSEERAGYHAKARNLIAGEGLAVAVIFPKDTIVSPEKKWEDESLLATLIKVPTAPVFGYLAFLIPLTLFVYLIYVLRTRVRGVRKRTDLTPRTTIPQGVSPSIASIVYDERIEPRTIVAEVVRLAQEGYVEIHSGTQAQHDSELQYTLVRTQKETSSEDVIANVLLSALFPSDTEGVSAKEVTLATLRDRFTEGTYEVIVEELYEEVLSKGYFLDNPTRARMVCMVSGGLVAVLFALGVYVSQHSTLDLLSVAGILSGIILLVLGAVLPARSAKGTTLLKELEEYKRALTLHDSVLFEDLETKKFSEQMSVHVAYGIAFSLEREWAERFAKREMVCPNWYVDKAGSMTGGEFMHTMKHFVDAFTAICVKDEAVEVVV